MTGSASKSLCLTVWFLFASAGSAEEVEVVVESAPIKVGDEILVSAPRNARLRVIRRAGPWVAVNWTPESGQYRGWVLTTHVRTVVDPGIDEDSPAPPAFDPVTVSIRDTQTLSRTPPAIFLHLTIANNGVETVSFDAAEISLRSNGDELRRLPPDEVRAPEFAYSQLSTTANDGTVSPQPAHRVEYLRAGELAPGSRVSGWLGFTVPEAAVEPLLAPPEDRSPDWRLDASCGGHSVSLDLRATEVEALGVTVRPSSLDPSVPVLEIGSRINLLNVDRLLPELERLLASEQGFVILAKQGSWATDLDSGMAIHRLLQHHAGPGSIRPVVAGLMSPQNLGPWGSVLWGGTEATAAVQVLAQRPGGSEILRQRLSDSVTEIRVTAAACLLDSLEDPDVVTALSRATRDLEPGVRFSALRVLSAGLGGLSTDWLSDLGTIPMAPLPTPLELDGALLEVMLTLAEDPDDNVRALAIAQLRRSRDRRATMAIIKAFADPVQAISANALQSAAGQPPELVVAPLLEKLNTDASTSTREMVCRVLGELESDAAVPILTELTRGRDQTVAVAAVDALRKIGALSPVDAALRKLDVPQWFASRWFTPDDRDALAHSQDPEVVAKLLAALTHENSSVVGFAAEVLGEMREAAAVEPLTRLIRIATAGYDLPAAVPLALGKIGDPRAVTSLEKLLKEQPNSARKPEVMAALVMLDTPGALADAVGVIRENARGSEARVLLPLVLPLMGPEGNELIRELLDHPQTCGTVAKILWEHGAPESREQLRVRLAAAEYQHAATALGELASFIPWRRAREDWEKSREQLQLTIELLDHLVFADNPDTRRAASDMLRHIETGIGAGMLRRLRCTQDAATDALRRMEEAIRAEPLQPAQNAEHE